MLKCRWARSLWFCLSLPLLKCAELSPEQSKPYVESQCGYTSCPKIISDKLNVHLIAHTHNDVGWIYTFEEYFDCNSLSPYAVECILNAVVKELWKDSKKRFIYVESAFFFKWWEKQNRRMQKKVRILVNEGRLEFGGGAWTMNDEATTFYQSIIDQFAWGLRNLNDTFGECGRPRIGWQIDSFGHSREMASMFAQMGYDGLFLGRLDYQDKYERLMTKKAELIWRASANLDEAAHLFTGALYNQYQPPPGFCFDVICADQPIIDGKHSPYNNVDKRVNEFFDFIKKQSKYYRTNNIIVTMGGDFTYQDANVYFKNLDKLIRYANARQENGSDINLMYSTPSCYLKSLHDAGMTWPTKDDDFFPYGSDPHAYWTGYFTSRPTFKRYERVGNHFLQVCKQLTALYPTLYPELLPNLKLMREAMGVVQHHDAISGTAKQYVADNYVQIVDAGMEACQANADSVLNTLMDGNELRPKDLGVFKFKTCSLLNISVCDVSEQSDKFILTLYNPLAHQTSDYVRLPVMDVNYLVKDHKDVVLDIQFVPVAKPVQKLHFRNSSAKFELVFLATEIPAFGYKSFYIQKSNRTHLEPVPDPHDRTGFIFIGNEHINLTFDSNGFLSAATADGMTRFLSQHFMYYEGAYKGDSRLAQNRPSGAYIFRPSHDIVKRFPNVPKITVYRGSLVDEVHQEFNNWISQIVRIYKQRRYAEFEWMVGPIPFRDGKGKEIITRFYSNIKSKGYFYTDSNGREMIKRLRNHRDTWKVKLLEKTAGNYYPIATKIALEDEHARMAILTDRAQGGSSMINGSLELMLHRRLLHDDKCGVAEALNETVNGEGLIARGTHFLIFGSPQLHQSPTLQALERFTQLERTLPPWKFLSDTKLSYDDWKQYTNIFTGISVSLPQHVHLLTFEPWHDKEILVRFEHILEHGEDPEYSKPVQLNIKDVFERFPIRDLRETTLDGSAWLDKNHRMEFVPDPESSQLKTEHLQQSPPREINRLRIEKLKKMKIPLDDLPLNKSNGSNFVMQLSAMQIRTFILYLE